MQHIASDMVKAVSLVFMFWDPEILSIKMIRICESVFDSRVSDA